MRAAPAALRRGDPKALVLAVPVILGGDRKRFDDVADATGQAASAVSMRDVSWARRRMRSATVRVA